jgi:hypothetical protein
LLSNLAIWIVQIRLDRRSQRLGKMLDNAEVPENVRTNSGVVEFAYY